MIFIVRSPRGHYKDDGIYQTIVRYCTDPDKMVSGYLALRNVNRNSIADDMYHCAARFGKLHGTRIRHMYLAFDPDREYFITSQMAYQLAEEVCDFYQGEYQIFATVHEDADHLHVHVVMNSVSLIDGKKYGGKKRDYYRFQNYLRLILRKYGCKLYVEKQ